MSFNEVIPDPLGTIRREQHDGGYSLWLRMDRGEYTPDSQAWTCVASTTEGNRGGKLPASVIQRRDIPIVGTLPPLDPEVAAREIDALT